MEITYWYTHSNLLSTRWSDTIPQTWFLWIFIGVGQDQPILATIKHHYMTSRLRFKGYEPVATHGVTARPDHERSPHEAGTPSDPMARGESPGNWQRKTLPKVYPNRKVVTPRVYVSWSVTIRKKPSYILFLIFVIMHLFAMCRQL